MNEVKIINLKETILETKPDVVIDFTQPEGEKFIYYSLMEEDL